MNPRHIKNYNQLLYKFMALEESIEKYVYACSQHVPTIGIGYALAERSSRGFSPRTSLDDDLAKIGCHMTIGDKERLERICQMLNEGTIRQAIVGNKFKESFDLTINPEQAKQLFLISVPKYDLVLRQKLGLKLYSELQNSNEMVVLFSLAYNAPSLIGKNLVNALKEGNRARVQYEILYNSNKKRDAVLDRRRHREAKLFGRYDNEAPTLEELRAEEITNKTFAAQITRYDSEMAPKRARGPKSLASNHRKRPQPGTAPNQKVARTRVDGAKAHPHPRGGAIMERIMDLFGSHDQVIYRNWDDHPAAHDDQHYLKRWS